MIGGLLGSGTGGVLRNRDRRFDHSLRENHPEVPHTHSYFLILETMKFFYPTYEIAIEAESQEEADKKLQETINPKPVKKNENPPKD